MRPNSSDQVSGLAIPLSPGTASTKPPCQNSPSDSDDLPPLHAASSRSNSATESDCQEDAAERIHIQVTVPDLNRRFRVCAPSVSISAAKIVRTVCSRVITHVVSPQSLSALTSLASLYVSGSVVSPTSTGENWGLRSGLSLSLSFSPSVVFKAASRHRISGSSVAATGSPTKSPTNPSSSAPLRSPSPAAASTFVAEARRQPGSRKALSALIIDDSESEGHEPAATDGTSEEVDVDDAVDRSSRPASAAPAASVEPTVAARKGEGGGIPTSMSAPSPWCSFTATSPAERRITGWLDKLGSGKGRFGQRNWKRRWFSAFADSISYRDTETASTYKNLIPFTMVLSVMCNISRADHPAASKETKRYFGLEIDEGSRTHILLLRSNDEERLRWVRFLVEVCSPKIQLCELP